MSSPVVSRWPVVVQVAVQDADRDSHGALSDAGAERMFAVARDAYFDLCRTVDRASITADAPVVRLRPGHVGDLVSVSAGVVEVFSGAFRMSVRIRSIEDQVAAYVNCTFSTAEPIPASMRDEFIALALGARHVH